MKHLPLPAAWPSRMLSFLRGLGRALLSAAAIVLAAAPAAAEVLDRPLGIRDIWLRALMALLLASAGLWTARRWPVLCGVLAASSNVTAWARWHDLSLGPAIALEAGHSYGMHANWALAIEAAFLPAFWLGAAWQRRGQHGEQRLTSSLPLALEAAAFSISLTLALLWRAERPSSDLLIWTSPPLIISSSISILSLAKCSMLLGRRWASR